MHSYHFYGPDGILRYATRILRPAVAPLRALPSNEADKSDSSRNTSIVLLPPLRSLLPLPFFPDCPQPIAMNEDTP